MEPETKQNSTTSQSVIDAPDSGVITKMPSSDTGKTLEDWQKTSQQFKTFVAEFAEFVVEFWRDNKSLVTALGFSLGLIVMLKVLLAVLGALNDLPLVAPTFELIGIGYAGWFIIRYLLRGSSREELGENINSVKEQVLGSREKLLDRLSSKGDEQ